LEDKYENWFSGFLDKPSLIFLKRITRVLGYSSLKEYYIAFWEASDACAKNPESFFNTDFSIRENTRLNHFSPIQELRYKLFIYRNKKAMYFNIRLLMLKHIITEDYSPTDVSIEHLKLIIERERCYAKVIAYRGIDHSPIIAHLEFILSQKQLFEQEKMFQIAQSDMKAMKNLDSIKKEVKETQLSSSKIIPAPKIQLGFLGNLIPLIAEDLQSEEFIDANDFLQLFDQNLIQIDKTIKWNRSLAELAYLFDEFINKKVIAPDERLKLPHQLNERMLYRDGEVYVPVTTKSFRNALNREAKNPSSEKTSKKEYLKLRTILEARFIEKVDSNIG
jgi:hypothetical protein